MEVLVGGGELLLVVAEVWVIKHLQGATLADADGFGLVLVEDVFQAIWRQIFNLFICSLCIFWKMILNTVFEGDSKIFSKISVLNLIEE